MEELKRISSEELKKQFFEITNLYKPFLDILCNPEKQKIYRNKYQYKGFELSPSPIIFQPKILFLGYNPAGGRDWKILQSKEYKPLEPHLEECEPTFFRRNSARNGEWYELNKQVKSSFPRKMVDLLYNLAALIYPERNNERYTNQKPFWAKDLYDGPMSLMFLNLYPIATPSGKDLIKLCNKLRKENNVPEEWKANEWEVRKYMIRIMYKIVKLLHPQLIVCLGSQTFHDYTYTTREKHSLNEILVYSSQIIGFSRKGAWENNLDNIVHAIYERIQTTRPNDIL